jgi:hypothetical protein
LTPADAMISGVSGGMLFATLTVYLLHGWQAHHERIFQALGLSPPIDDVSAIQKNDLAVPKGPGTSPFKVDTKY